MIETSAMLQTGNRLAPRHLRGENEPDVLALLELDVVPNLQMLEQVITMGITRSGATVGVTAADELVAVATTLPTLYAGADPRLDDADLFAAGRQLGEALRSVAVPLKAFVATSRLVSAIWPVLSSLQQAPTVDRQSQPIYTIPTENLAAMAGAQELRRSSRSDLDLLVDASAAMYREELGIDPIERDARWFRNRTLNLIERGRSWIWMHRGRIAFKCEVAASACGIAQLMGVWTDPSLRRRGFAREGLPQVSAFLAKDHHLISLFVNDYNHAARNLYERLGFEQQGEMRAMIW